MLDELVDGRCRSRGHVLGYVAAEQVASCTSLGSHSSYSDVG